MQVSESDELRRLRAELESVREERDAAVAALAGPPSSVAGSSGASSNRSTSGRASLPRPLSSSSLTSGAGGASYAVSNASSDGVLSTSRCKFGLPTGKQLLGGKSMRAAPLPAATFEVEPHELVAPGTQARPPPPPRPGSVAPT